VRFNVEARRRYLDFAGSKAAVWSGNFRELASSVTRLATLANGGRITEADVVDEIERLRAAWGGSAAVESSGAGQAVLGEAWAALDLFDRCQLETVLHICRRARNLSEAGRILFAQSRQQRKQTNDADRLRKYLMRFDLDWEKVTAA
jgi:transcriptional regulatory protein RtcR